MSAAVITERKAEASPRTRARIIGVVYLLFFLTAVPGEIFLQQAGISGIQLGVSSGDAAVIANKLLAHESLFQVGFALTLLSTACYVALTALLYGLFKSVSRSLALIAALFSLMGLAVQTAGSLLLLAPLAILGGSSYLSVFDTKQQQALALLSLNVNSQVGYISLVFDGLWLLLVGYLIVRSTFLPPILGAVVALAGLGWEILLWPPLANVLYSYIQVLGFVGEAALMFWLLVVGVNEQRWKERASALDRSLA